jgi:hypothetical protein
MSLYTIQSERLLCEQLDYNLLFRWFLGMGRTGRRPVLPSVHGLDLKKTSYLSSFWSEKLPSARAVAEKL